MKIAIITVGYNRPNSMKRLLSSLQKAIYDSDSVDLIISIDKGRLQNEIIDVANKFNWVHGNKIIRSFAEKQGLRAHILQCGDLVSSYDGIIVLEDDLEVAQDFYSYSKQMIRFYGKDSRIGGISLYKHLINPGNGRLFNPEESSYDVYFMQVAQSWGQCWTKQMWVNFRQWYNKNDGVISSSVNFPKYIAQWNQASWLKYFNKYCVDNDLFWVYPYKSLSTNHTEIGEHAYYQANDYQVPLLIGEINYRCPSLEDGIKYDIFFERVGIEDRIFKELQGKKMLDLMGLRQEFGDSKYLFSVQKLPYKVIKKIQLRYRPIEENLIKPIDGDGIYVYDLECINNKPKYYSIILARFEVRAVSWKKTLVHGILGFCEAIYFRLKH